LNVDVNKDSVGTLTPSGYAISTKHVKTQVLVENGGTLVIGGIFEPKPCATSGALAPSQAGAVHHLDGLL
jgi:type II secretory pathway component HofQ